MTHWIGAIILLAALAFVIFAFRQGEKRAGRWKHLRHLAAGGARGFFAGADCGAAGLDAGRGGFCDVQAKDSWQSHRGVAFLRAPPDHV